MVGTAHPTQTSAVDYLYLLGIINDMSFEGFNQFTLLVQKQFHPLRLRTGFCIYFLGLCTIWVDRFVNYGFTHPKTYLWVVLFFVGVPLSLGSLAATIMFLIRRKQVLNCLHRALTWSLAVFGVALICLTVTFWIERTMGDAREPAVDKKGGGVAQLEVPGSK